MSTVTTRPAAMAADAPVAPASRPAVADPTTATSGSLPWVDLLAAGLLRGGSLGDGPPVVLASALCALPLLESQGPVAWVHTAPPAYRSFVPVAHGQPALRLQVDAAARPAEAARLLHRAALCLVLLPPQPGPAAAMAALAAQAAQARVPLLVVGAPSSAGWAAFEPVLQAAALQPLQAGDVGLDRVLASPGLASQLGPAGLRDSARATALAAHLARTRQADLHLEPLPGGRLRLRLRVDPLRLVVAGAETQAHHIAHSGRALFNGRGLGALLLPWGAAAQARLLLRNVRARLDGCQFALGAHALAPTGVDYLAHGAVLRLALPAVAPGRDALLHLSLPREAVPGDGFCDIGAAEFTVETD